MGVEQWEDFYRGGALATGPSDLDGFYDLEVAAVWRKFFDGLPAEGRLLDLGTGNGVLALMALEHARIRGAVLSIDACDLARIDPCRHVHGGESRFAGIRFHPGMAMERLGFEDASFDAVVGHYALEYGDISEALSEIRRVLRPAGHAQFVMHHAGSVLLESAQHTLEESDAVLRHHAFYRKLSKLLTLENATPSTIASAQEDVVQAIRALRAKMDAARIAKLDGGRVYAVALDAAKKLLDARRTTPAALVGLEVERAENAMRLAAHRQADLITAAKDADGIANVCRVLEALGFEDIDVAELHHDVQHLVGWRLRFRRR